MSRANSPTSPISSPKLGMMKSDSAKYVRSGRPRPRPVPNIPPAAMPMSPLASWSEACRASGLKVSSHSSTRVWTCPNIRNAT